MHSLHAILAALRPQSQGFCYPISEDWLQGRTVFGGLIAALANQSMRSLIPADRPLRALQIVYVGPNSAGDVQFEPVILRAGKAVTLANCTVRSGGEASATVTAMYGTARASMLNIKPQAELQTEVLQAPDQLTNVANNRPGFSPGFTQHYDQRWARGAYPFSQATDSRMSVYLRYRDEDTACLTEAHALAMMDAIPSPALALMATPSPASTLSWTLEILDHQFDFGVNDWWRLDAMVDAAADGYVTHSGVVVNPAGRVTAISRQVVVVYG
jgi:acyl-CoA thioesterase